MHITFPNTAYELLVMFVPYVTILLGLAYLIFPAQLIHYSGLRSVPGSPHAIGEGRSSFAGPMLALGLGSVLLQEPIALQPGLSFSIALAWSLAAFGRLMQIVFDAGWRKRLQFRLIISLVLAGLAWYVAEVPNFVCLDVSSVYCAFPQTIRGQAIWGVAAISLVMGLIALFLPGQTLSLMKLEPRARVLFAIGEPRGLLAGMYISIGLVVLLTPQPVEFVALVLAGCWALTGAGRFISIVVDRAFGLFNVLTTLFELGLGIWLGGLILGYF